MKQNNQQWLIDTIPTEWEDKVELLQNLIFTCLIHFVEKEDGISKCYLDWSTEHCHVTREYVDNNNKVYGELQGVYNYIKTDRPQLTIDFENSYPNPIEHVGIFGVIPQRLLTTKTCEEAFRENTRIKNLIDEKDQWAMHTVITHIKYLWT